MLPLAACDTLIINGYVITMDGHRNVFTHGYIAITDGKIVAAGRMGALGHCADKTIDARGAVVMPGMVNGHNHLVQNMFRGYNDQRWPVLDIPAAVRKLIAELFSISAVMDEERSHAIVRLHALEMLKAGYVATHDEHFTNVRKDSVDGSWRALAESGMRGFLCRCIVNSDKVPATGHEDVEAGLQEVERLRKFGSDRIQVAASFVNYSFLEKAGDMRIIHEAASTMGVGFGVDMTDNSRGAGLAARGHDGGQVSYYARYGLLDRPIYAGKAVNVLPGEFDLLADAGARCALVPMLRFFDGAGLPLHRFLERGMLPGLGTDAPLVTDCQDPFEVMRMTILAQNMAVKNEVASGAEKPAAAHWATAERVLEMATLGGASALFMDDVTGSLEPGKAADCIIVDIAGAEFLHTPQRRIGALVWAGRAAQVRDVFIGGEQLIADGRSTRWDEEIISIEAAAAMTAMVSDAGLQNQMPTRSASESFRDWHYS